MGVLGDDRFQYLYDSNNRVGGPGLPAAAVVALDAVAQIDQPPLAAAEVDAAAAVVVVDGQPIPLKYMVEVVGNDATDCNLVGEDMTYLGLCLMSRRQRLLPRQKQHWMMRLYRFYHAYRNFVLVVVGKDHAGGQYADVVAPLGDD